VYAGKDAIYEVEGHAGLAYRFRKFKTTYDEDGWPQIDEGWCVMVAVGDDRDVLVEEGDIAPIQDDDYCGHCGQIGCPWS
jgi:hypothetical protein